MRELLKGFLLRPTIQAIDLLVMSPWLAVMTHHAKPDDFLSGNPLPMTRDS